MKLLCKQETTFITGANSIPNNTPILVNIMGLPTECIRPYSNFFEAIISEIENIEAKHDHPSDFDAIKNIFNSHKKNMSPVCLNNLDVFSMFMLLT